MGWVKIYAIMLPLLMGAVSCAAQSVEKYDPEIDSEIARENKMAEKYYTKSYYTPGLEDKILDKVWDIPEVQKRDAYLKSISKGKRYLGECIYRRPYDNNSYYWVKVGEDFGGIIVSHFNFYVDPKTLSVKYFYPENDSYTDLVTWQKRQKE